MYVNPSSSSSRAALKNHNVLDVEKPDSVASFATHDEAEDTAMRDGTTGK